MQNVTYLLQITLISLLLVPSNSKAQVQPWFPQSYEEGRQRLLENAQKLGVQSKLVSEIKHYALPNAPDLTIDTVSLTNPKGCSKVVIMVSGTHGAEGFVGSAIQSHVMTQILPGLPNPPCFLFVHALNPFGFKNLRRVTENNVDLNRNFPIEETMYLQANQGYRQIQSFLNPSQPASLYWGSKIQFFAEAILQVAQHGLSTLRQSILLGQYEFEKGIFFGGKKQEPQVELVKTILNDSKISAPITLFIDLHTGYGKRGELHLLGDLTPGSDKALIETIYKDEKIEFGETKDFYKVTGGLNAFVGNYLKEKSRVANLVFEYGTMDSQKLTGSIESLRRMILENQMIQSGADTETQAKIRDLFKEIFFPQNVEWQKNVLVQTDTLLKKILAD